MNKILFGSTVISLCVLISSCENLLDSNQCDCEIVISNYNYTISEWEETDRYFHEQNFDDGGCADRIILSTGDFDTISTTHYINGEIDTFYQVSSGVYNSISSVYQPEWISYDTERLSGYKEELDCPMYYN
tara:strand:+ start:95 stop:487 length:393 start_codon:yes stop_codon:yes gene_type:complete